MRDRVESVSRDMVKPIEHIKTKGINGAIIFWGSARIPSQEKSSRILGSKAINGGTPGKIAKLSKYYKSAEELSFRLAKWCDSVFERPNRCVICSGGGGGIMEAANTGAALAGCENIGLNIKIPSEQKINPQVTDGLSVEFEYFMPRKFWFMYLAKAIVVFPGGFGTLDETFEALTLIQTGRQRTRLPFIFFGSQFWKSLINFDLLCELGLVEPEAMASFHFSDTVEDSFDFITKNIEK
ncbi:MAG: LOG family protein [Puniceicoccales bacterium]|nr:LOG family protein [Puniceicoccales bacterium]